MTGKTAVHKNDRKISAGFLNGKARYELQMIISLRSSPLAPAL
jgi:hypothetical protein